MTIKEIHNQERDKRQELREEIKNLEDIEIEILKNKLIDLGLGGRVRYKGNGHIGELHVTLDGFDPVSFYPLTKKGEISKRPEYHWGDRNDIEVMYEPYKED